MTVRKTKKESSSRKKAATKSASKKLPKKVTKKVTRKSAGNNNSLLEEIKSELDKRFEDLEILIDERLNELSIQILTLPTKRSLRTDSALLGSSPPMDKGQDTPAPYYSSESPTRAQKSRGFSLALRRFFSRIRFWDR